MSCGTRWSPGRAFRGLGSDGDKDADTVKTSVLIPTTGDIATVREHAAMADRLGYD